VEARDPGFRRELGLVDAAVVVAGAIVGVGIFANPSNVARILGSSDLVLLAWAAGGALALAGGFAYAELGARMPMVGGQYAWLARIYHPIVGFLYGVALLFIINGGSIAAVSILFASYFERAVAPVGGVGVRLVAAGVLVLLTSIHTLGIRAGKWTNNLVMAAKVLGILLLVVLAFAVPRDGAAPAEDGPTPAGGLVTAFLTALVPIVFAYGGWQNCASIAGEIRDPARNLARATVLGVALVVVLYLALNVAYLHVLGARGVAESGALAADVARRVAGDLGGRIVSSLIVVSSLGFLSVILLTGSRLYWAMAADGLLFRGAARIHPRFRTPAVALWLQTLVSIALLTTNTYDQLLSYVVFADWMFMTLTVAALFRMRRIEAHVPGTFHAPGHPVTTLVFVVVGVGVVTNSFLAYPTQSWIGSAILASAAAFYGLALRKRGDA
jgi:APA family basic amino acid/polyamine antiporter